MGNHRLGKNAKEAELNGKEETTKGSLQWEITGLQYLAYLSGKRSEEAELNRKKRTTWGSFQQEISSLGVLNWTSSFQIHTLQNLCLSQQERRDNQAVAPLASAIQLSKHGAVPLPFPFVVPFAPHVVVVFQPDVLHVNAHH